MGGVSSGAREVLNKVLDILEQGLRDIAKARDTVIDTGKRNIADVSWIKVKALFERLGSVHAYCRALVPGHRQKIVLCSHAENQSTHASTIN